jgi:hypothetical protein
LMIIEEISLMRRLRSIFAVLFNTELSLPDGNFYVSGSSPYRPAT